MGRKRIHPDGAQYIYVALTREERGWLRKRGESPSLILRKLINDERERDLQRVLVPR